MKKRLLAAFAALTVLMLLASACSGSSEGSTEGSEDTTETANADGGDIAVPDDAEPVEAPDFDNITPEVPAPQAEDDPNAVYVTALESLQAFWVENFPALYGADFAELPASRILPIAPGEDSGEETCEGGLVDFSVVEGNAIAFQCSEGQMVGWDADPTGVMATTAEEFGPLASSAILAHEFGHVVQYQSGGELETPYSELQADCFAGAWVAAVSADPPAGLEGFGDPAAVDATLSAMITLRDPVGFDAADEDAHGSGFDRVRTFQDGVERGAEECAGYADQPPTVVEVAFTDEADAATGGNAPLEELVPLAAEDLDLYYSLMVEGWEPLGTLGLEDIDPEQVEFLTGLADEFGDGAPLVFVSLGWAQALQELVGANEGRDETGQLLQSVCLVGDWMAHAFFDVEGDPTYGSLTLSPGDLDEAILGLIQVSSGSDGTDAGFTFELISAFRQGVIDRVDSCGLDS